MRTEILTGKIAPGSKLPFAELGERFEASQGVLREALARLVAEGLVISEPQIGYSVMPLSITDLRDLTEARSAIEGLVFESSIEAGDVEWESRVVAAHHRMERTPTYADELATRVSEQWATAHGEFHSALLSACTNRRLISTALALRASAEVYRQWSVAVGKDERDISGEHLAMMTAALDRDVNAARESLRQHLYGTMELLIGAAEAMSSTN